MPTPAPAGQVVPEASAEMTAPTAIASNAKGAFTAPDVLSSVVQPAFPPPEA